MDGKSIFQNLRKIQYRAKYKTTSEENRIIANRPKEFWPDFLEQLCESVAKPYAKTFDYFHGLLGITDTILEVGTRMHNKTLTRVRLKTT